jgi:quercetin dioxygenase-like cupin family protein
VAAPGERIEDALSGATIVFRRTAAETDGELLQVEMSARPRWSAGPLHIHPRQEERVHVIAGRLRSRVGGVERDHRPTEVVSVPPGTPHTLANAGAEDVRLLVEFRPALRSENLFETFFGVGPGRSTARRLRDLVRLLVATRGYRDEIRIAWRSLL